MKNGWWYITYIHTLKNGWTYLASILDLYSKKIIDFTHGTNMKNELVMTAIRKSIFFTKAWQTIIFHTDLRSQYTSNHMKNLCEKLNIIQSSSKKGCPYDNSCIESFHASLKK